MLNWSHAPLVIMDDEVEENEEYAMKEYIRHYTSPMVSKPLKYDLKNLNDKLSLTTINPWDGLMYKNEYLPNSFSGNMLSALSVKNNRQAVDENQDEKLSILKTLRQDNGEDVNCSDKNETLNQKLNLVEDLSEKYNYNQINSYVS